MIVVVSVSVLLFIEEEESFDFFLIKTWSAPTPTTVPTASGTPFRWKKILIRARTPCVVGFNKLPLFELIDVSRILNRDAALVCDFCSSFNFSLVDAETNGFDLVSNVPSVALDNDVDEDEDDVGDCEIAFNSASLLCVNVLKFTFIDCVLLP